MNLKLKNIGIIEEADIKLDGLTVIAGENDSGKSTVGKVLYSCIKTIKWASNTSDKPYCDYFNRYIKNLFNAQISKKGTINFIYQDLEFNVSIKNDRCDDFIAPIDFENDESKATAPIFIDSPYIWNIFSTLNTIDSLGSRGGNIDFEVNETLQDLHFAMKIRLKDSDNKIKLDIHKIIGGQFEENSLGVYTFKKDNQNIELINTAMGIKYFGILQVLADKNHLYNGQVLILDEPEVHLHPKWQLELAKVIVYLVENGVKILVNSHSPYMIEALERYSELNGIKDKTNFYLAHNNIIEKIEDSNSRTLSEIFEKLSEPFDTFENIKSDRL